MTEEDEIKNALTGRFKFLENNIRVQRPRRIFVDVPAQNFEEVFKYAIKDLKFVILCTITGLDEGENLAFIYHISKENGIVLNIKMKIPRERPILKTITGYFSSAEIYEREIMDLLGAKVEGLAAGKRYPLPDDWPAGEFPLRKDWKKANKKG